MDEIPRAGDGAIHMGFSGQMHDVGDAVALDSVQHSFFVAEIDVFERVFWMGRDAFEVLQMAGVGQAVQIDQFLDQRFVDDAMHDIGSDEAGAACDEKIHCPLRRFASATTVSK